MSLEMKKNLILSEDSMAEIEKRMSELSSQGITAIESKSGELNISGCASGYCQAWA